MNYLSKNHFEIFMLLWMPHVASLDNTCHHGDEHCKETSPDNKYRMETNLGIPDKPKKILYWTHFYGHRDFEFGYGQKPFIEAGCPVSNCITTGTFQSNIKFMSDGILLNETFLRVMNIEMTSRLYH